MFLFLLGLCHLCLLEKTIASVNDIAHRATNKLDDSGGIMQWSPWPPSWSDAEEPCRSPLKIRHDDIFIYGHVCDTARPPIYDSSFHPLASCQCAVRRRLLNSGDTLILYYNECDKYSIDTSNHPLLAFSELFHFSINASCCALLHIRSSTPCVD